MSADERYGDALIDEMETTYRNTRSWLVVRSLPDREENVVCFSSGLGDGCHPSFFGLSTSGEVIALVTEFAVLFGDAQASEDRAPPRRRWQFWRRG